MPHTNAKYRLDNIYHLDAMRLARCVGEWDIPVLRRERFVPARLIGFNHALNTRSRDVCVHFFIDDYQFERVWRQPQNYIHLLSGFECVLTPDFSLLLDMPAAMKVWNVYRNRAIGQLLQDNGCRVIPSVSWAEPASFRYCFEGIATHATVAVSSRGVVRDAAALAAWHRGMDALLERLEPETLLFHGKPIERDYGSAAVVSFSDQRMEGGGIQWAGAELPMASQQ